MYSRIGDAPGDSVHFTDTCLGNTSEHAVLTLTTSGSGRRQPMILYVCEDIDGAWGFSQGMSVLESVVLMLREPPAYAIRSESVV